MTETHESVGQGPAVLDIGGGNGAAGLPNPPRIAWAAIPIFPPPHPPPAFAGEGAKTPSPPGRGVGGRVGRAVR